MGETHTRLRNVRAAQGQGLEESGSRGPNSPAALDVPDGLYRPGRGAAQAEMPRSASSSSRFQA